jgi:predicted Zn finger-like uncharacterized protein
MIVRCPDCRSKYEIAADKIPAGVFKLRCPRCKAVFPVNPQGDGDGTPAEASAVSPPEAVREVQLPEPKLPPREPAGSGPQGHPMPIGAAIARPRISDPALARRMARAMISEMVLNRRGERDDALLSETVLSSFGPALAAAFEVYRSKVAADLPGAPAYFRDAVNEILGGGAQVL